MKNRGFSLMELMIVVAIIMILGGGGMWSLKNRLYKNEIIKIKAAVPTLLNSGALRVYEKGASGATLTATGSSVSISNVGAGMEVKSNMFTFVTSPASLDIWINDLGGLETSPQAIDGTWDFDILVKDRNSNDVMTFAIKSKGFGVFRVDVVE